MELQWPLILFTFFVALSSGILFMQGLLSWQGKGKSIQLASVITSLVALVVGGIAVFFHLQHWERIFNGFGHITSGITQELIGCVLMGIALVLFFLMMRRTDDGSVPKWVSAVAIIVPVVMVFIMAHSYNMEGRPSWNTPMLEVYYLINMVALGSVAVLIIAAVKKAEDAFELTANVAFISSVLLIIAVIVYAVLLNGSTGTYADHGYYFDPTLPDVAVTDTAAIMGSIMTGSCAVAFWGGAVVLGGVLPAALMFMARKANEPSKLLCYGAVSLVGLVIGSFCWRGILYVVALTIFTIF